MLASRRRRTIARACASVFRENLPTSRELLGTKYPVGSGILGFLWSATLEHRTHGLKPPAPLHPMILFSAISSPRTNVSCPKTNFGPAGSPSMIPSRRSGAPLDRPQKRRWHMTNNCCIFPMAGISSLFTTQSVNQHSSHDNVRVSQFSNDQYTICIFRREWAANGSPGLTSSTYITTRNIGLSRRDDSSCSAKYLRHVWVIGRGAGFVWTGWGGVCG